VATIAFLLESLRGRGRIVAFRPLIPALGVLASLATAHTGASVLQIWGGAREAIALNSDGTVLTLGDKEMVTLFPKPPHGYLLRDPSDTSVSSRTSSPQVMSLENDAEPDNRRNFLACAGTDSGAGSVLSSVRAASARPAPLR